MDISIKKRKTFICFVLLLSFFLIGCSNVKKNDAEKTVIKIKGFTVDQKKFKVQMEQLAADSNEMTREDAALFLLNNYISAGLLVEEAKKMYYERRNDFITEVSTYKDQLIIKYSKNIRSNASKLHPVDDTLIHRILQNEIKMNYVRIPKKQEALSKTMLLYFLNRNNISQILNDSELATWDKKGLSFYENISLKDAILTEKTIAEIIPMKVGEVKLIKDKSAYYIVRILQSIKTPIRDIADYEPIKFNLQKAQSLENGDIMFDPYRFEKSIVCNEKLLSRIDFSIAPFYSDSMYVAQISEKFISENEILEKIPDLPIKIQCLFVNQSTRIKAIATLILLDYCKKGKPENVSDWLQPYKINGFNQLKFDFEKIEKMEITRKDTIDNQILAYSDNWKITVKDFMDELDRLTPITRLDIANNNLIQEMIEYLAKRGNGVNSQLIINSNLFNLIDVMGKSYDKLSYLFDEHTIIGKLENIVLTVKELRESVANLPEYEKDQFFNLSTRKESFNDIIAEKFWLNLYNRKIVEENPDFKREILNYQNKLLFNLLYKNQIQDRAPQIDDENSDIKTLQDVKNKNDDRLFSFIQNILQNYPIQVDSAFFQKNFNLNIETSKYHNVIIINVN